MWENVGVIRSPAGLKTALNKLKKINLQTEKNYRRFPNEKTLSARNISSSALLIATAAARRRRSLGCHFVK